MAASAGENPPQRRRELWKTARRGGLFPGERGRDGITEGNMDGAGAGKKQAQGLLFSEGVVVEADVRVAAVRQAEAAGDGAQRDEAEALVELAGRV